MLRVTAVNYYGSVHSDVSEVVGSRMHFLPMFQNLVHKVRKELSVTNLKFRDWEIIDSE